MSLTSQQLQSIELLASGLPRTETAQKLGITRRTLERWAKLAEYKNALDIATGKTTQEVIAATIATIEKKPNLFFQKQEARNAEVELLDTLQASILEEARGGNLRAIAMILKISERRSKLLGLDIENMIALSALEVLFHEGIYLKKEAEIISNAINDMIEDLRNVQHEKAN